MSDARSFRRRQAGQSALVRGWVYLCGRWRLYVLLRAHTAKVIGLEMRRTCNTDASRATGWTASMSSPYVRRRPTVGSVPGNATPSQSRSPGSRLWTWCRRRLVHTPCALGRSARYIVDRRDEIYYACLCPCTMNGRRSAPVVLRRTRNRLALAASGRRCPQAAAGAALALMSPCPCTAAGQHPH
jgi:hypothetical protein